MVIPWAASAVLTAIVLGMDLEFGNNPSGVSLAVRGMCAVCIELVCLLRVVGMFQEQRPALQLSNVTGDSPKAVIPPVLDVHGEAWAAKVHELAGRSIEVGELLLFYALLGNGGLMPHYDPLRSTTNDVVRQAVVPLSRAAQSASGGVAYSEHLGRDIAPAQCLVTHTWSNLFVDLVAAVVADSMELESYHEVASALAEGEHEVIQRELQLRGASHQAYWICAFCVNQHANICGGFGHEPPQATAAHAKWDAARRDSATGKVFDVCGCGRPKVFNDMPDECELNKFDHIMALLHNEVPGFRQLVAVDRAFVVFSRAWCVAELVQAHHSGLPQRVQLWSCEGLRDDAEDLDLYIKLATLTVSHAEASRPEDKELILAKIGSVPEFDAQLQAVIFGERGLLSRRFVGFGIIEAAANTARRLKELLAVKRQQTLVSCPSTSSISSASTLSSADSSSSEQTALARSHSRQSYDV